jgi:hypothetical protein
MQSLIHGRQWIEGRDNVMRYLVKHVGCRLAEDGVQVPQPFVRFLNTEDPEPEGLELILHMSLDIVEAEQHLFDAHGMPSGSLWMGASIPTFSQAARRLTQISSHIGVGPFRFSYDVFFDGQRPCLTNLASDEVHVSTFRNLPPEWILQNCNECR